jgi:hypothetical protein
MSMVAITTAWEFLFLLWTARPAGMWTSSLPSAHPMVSRASGTRATPAYCMHRLLHHPVLSITPLRRSFLGIDFVLLCSPSLFILSWSELMWIHGFFLQTFLCKFFTGGLWVERWASVQLLLIFLRVPLRYLLRLGLCFSLITLKTLVSGNSLGVCL